jgi:hypothetical protein
MGSGVVAPRVDGALDADLPGGHVDAEHLQAADGGGAVAAAGDVG